MNVIVPRRCPGRIRTEHLQNTNQERYCYANQLDLDIGIVTCMSDYRRGFGLDIGFIDHLEVVTTNNYNTVCPARNVFTGVA
jgi:hypothetical protein